MKGKSTLHNLSDLKKRMDGNREAHNHSFCLFIDFKKAFDTVDRAILIKKLESAGVHSLVLDYLQ